MEAQAQRDTEKLTQMTEAKQKVETEEARCRSLWNEAQREVQGLHVQVAAAQEDSRLGQEALRTAESTLEDVWKLEAAATARERMLEAAFAAETKAVQTAEAAVRSALLARDAALEDAAQLRRTEAIARTDAIKAKTALAELAAETERLRQKHVEQLTAERIEASRIQAADGIRIAAVTAAAERARDERVEALSEMARLQRAAMAANRETEHATSALERAQAQMDSLRRELEETTLLQAKRGQQQNMAMADEIAEASKDLACAVLHDRESWEDRRLSQLLLTPKNRETPHPVRVPPQPARSSTSYHHMPPKLAKFCICFSSVSRDDPAHVELRNELWGHFSTHGRHLSLADVRNGIHTVLAATHGKDGTSIYHRFFVSFAPAFDDAKAASVAHRTGCFEGDHHMTRSEFRLLMVYLRLYATWYEVFMSIANFSSGSDTLQVQTGKSQSTYISRTMWATAIEWVHTVGNTWAPFVCLREAHSGDFDNMDRQGGNQVTFGLFCEWIKDAEKDVDADAGVDS